MKSHLGAIALVALLVPALAGCGKEPTAPRQAASDAPAVPPSASMAFDFALFRSAPATQAYAAHPSGVDATLARSNWINAVVRVVYINLTVADIFAPPVQALEAALHTTPVLGEDGWFTWTYAFTQGPRVVTLRLRGRIDGAKVTWRMLVTDPAATPAMQDFPWFTGESRLTNDGGFWEFNDRRNGLPVAVARIDWSASATRRELGFRNIDAGSADLGDQLLYQVDGDQDAITFHDASDGTDADITWNEKTGAGSLRVPDYNGGERACWDEHQENATCPN
jgi:hypothetical protein